MGTGMLLRLDSAMGQFTRRTLGFPHNPADRSALEQSILGIGTLVIKSGTIPVRSIPPMVAITSGLIILLLTGYLIALVCSRVGR